MLMAKKNFFHLMIKEIITDEKNILSDTYKLLYKTIIEDLLAQICNSDINYCVRDDKIPYEIGEKFEEYKDRATSNMSGKWLDRHKLASCICGAIIEVRPLTGYNGAVILKKANEILALNVGMAVLKYYMMYDLSCSPDAYEYLKEKFELRFPTLEENICDTQEYEKNLYNALYWSHKTCSITNKECFCYDIWAYSKIFYHLERYNKEFLDKVYAQYTKTQE